MSVTGHSKLKKKIVLGSSILIIFMIGFILFVHFFGKDDTHKQYSFEKIEDQFFYLFNVSFPEEDKYEFISVDGYCIEDENKIGSVQYFINAKYKGYIYLEDKWSEIDEVAYGDSSRLINSYCLSWNNIDGFEKVNEDFQRAVKEGYHKSYSNDEIQKLLVKNKPNK